MRIAIPQHFRLHFVHRNFEEVRKDMKNLENIKIHNENKIEFQDNIEEIM